jgi:uncharacterized protein
MSAGAHRPGNRAIAGAAGLAPRMYGVMVAVFASPEDEGLLQAILSTLADAGVETYGLKLRSNWESVPRGAMISHLEKGSHSLVLATAANVASSWFRFIVGYGYRRDSNMSLFRVEPTQALPEYLADIRVFDGIAGLADYYRTERANWIAQETRRASSAALFEMGLSVNIESLAQCAGNGDTKAVELFMRAGFSPDSRDKHGVPLLCLAARGKHRAIVELLLDRGARIDLQSEDRGYSPLMDAARASCVDLVGLFLEKGANPDLISIDGQTALIVAVGSNDVEMSRLLVQGGANPDISDKLGLSARKYAALFKNKDILSLF